MTLRDESARTTCCAGTSENAMHKLGTFEYSLDEIGLDEAVIRDRMAATSSCSTSSPTDVTHVRAGRRVSAMSSPRTLSGTGVWSPELRYGDPAEIADLAAELESLGFSALWMPDVGCGADHVCVQVIAPPGERVPLDDWRRLARAVV